MHEKDEVDSAYTVQDLLENTCPVSALVLIGQLHKVKIICIGAESVHQNCVIGRCAHLHIATRSILLVLGLCYLKGSGGRSSGL